MPDDLANLFSELGFWAVPVSLAINATVNILGFFPSVAVTAANVLVWGPWIGFLLSWMGEVIGSAAAFFLYRAGIRAANISRHRDWKWVRSISSMPGREQFLALTLARITPFIPAGAVNLAGSLTQVTFLVFLLSTAIGKIPSIALETLVSHDLIHINEHLARLIAVLFVLAIGYLWLKNRKAAGR
jgi:uncharacterized membrane protein YdjX (TVP38/TMEM64 family)